MKYKIYQYTLEDNKGKQIGPDRHEELFRSSIGRDSSGEFAVYRGQKNAVLMYVRKFSKDFVGLIGKFSSERDINLYNEKSDEVIVKRVPDDDYPNVPFIAFPRLGFIVVADKGSMRADAAVSRLHNILAHRVSAFFVAHAYSQSVDLRIAVKRMNVKEVSFEVYPVNPHTGDLGRALDESRKKDKIAEIKGRMLAASGKKLELNGGLLTSVQQLQQSGHCKVGIKGNTEGGVEVEIPKQKKREPMRESADDDTTSLVETKITIADEPFPFTQGYIGRVRVVVKLLAVQNEDE